VRNYIAQLYAVIPARDMYVSFFLLFFLLKFLILAEYMESYSLFPSTHVQYF